ncbi:MAG: hypothetical protein LBN05_00260 [Oscillospiraceae bacterium]|jgi:hypothetical protein|nr:hypothetical protein [Oscillospiraceae bacterium]
MVSARQKRATWVAVLVPLTLFVLVFVACDEPIDQPVDPSSTEERTSFVVRPTLQPGGSTAATAATQPLPSTQEPTTGEVPTSPPPTLVVLPSTSAAPPRTTTTQPPTTTVIPTKPVTVPASLKTIDGIVAYFNKAANEAKDEADDILQTVEKNTFSKLIFSGADLSDWVRRRNVDRAPHEIDDDDLPIKGKRYASRLAPASVQSAACKVDGDDYVLTIKLKKESGQLNQENSRHGQVMDVTTWDGMERWAKILNSLPLPGKQEGLKALDYTITYSGCVITARIHRESGHLRSSHYIIHTQVIGKTGKDVVLEQTGVKEDAYEFRW